MFANCCILKKFIRASSLLRLIQDHTEPMQDAPEFWISREDYLEEGIACLSKCGQA